MREVPHVLAQRDGWSLVRHDITIAPGRAMATWWLDNLAMTGGQAAELMRRRREQAMEVSGYCPDAGLSFMTARVTPGEAIRLNNGEEPLDVLIPVLYARALSVAEMMGEG
jgi:hypothetical protein